MKLAQLVGTRSLTSALWRLYANPLLGLRLSGPVASELLIAPQDISTADMTRANEIYTGYFSFGGHTVNCRGASPFTMENMPIAWQRELHEFGWLKHLRAAENSNARNQARLFVDDWIRLNSKIKGLPWDVECVAKRVIAWLCHSPLLLEGCEHKFYHRFMRSLTRQVRYLRLNIRNTPVGMPRLIVTIALSYAAISMADNSSFIRKAIKRLDNELKAQILPDGGHVSRNPNAVITLLALLMPLRQAIIGRDIVPSEILIGAIDRLVPALRFFRMGDGSFALFNGMGDTPGDLVATLLSHDDAGGAPVLNATHSGYQRLMGDDVVLLMDTGKLPPPSLSYDMHAGCLSFELSSGLERIVVNCGHLSEKNDGGDVERLAKIIRSTAAHSTLSINEDSSCRFITNKRLSAIAGTSVLSGPTHVEIDRSINDTDVSVSAEHDGYLASLGLKHQRSVSLSPVGIVLSGQDSLLLADGRTPSKADKTPYHIRFHLHPFVTLELSSPRTVDLTLRSGQRWLFTCLTLDVRIEETMNFSDIFGMRAASQIVLEGRVGEQSTVEWSFQKLAG